MTTFMQSLAHNTIKLDTDKAHIVNGGGLGRTKQLKRLPHVFCKWLELPFADDTNVEIEESRESYKFVVRQEGLSESDVVAEAVEIVPGAVKVMLRGQERIRAMLVKNGGIDGGASNWRARLPPSAKTEAIMSSYAQGVITISIAKLPSAAPSSSPPPPPPPPSRSRCVSQDVKRVSWPCLV
ncbi:hypothetical protein L7F22_033303 [Adiantum nelumboides]|nr:hypothetical protein [Adiantum nelumboides]